MWLLSWSANACLREYTTANCKYLISIGEAGTRVLYFNTVFILSPSAYSLYKNKINYGLIQILASWSEQHTSLKLLTQWETTFCSMLEMCT